MVFNVLPLNTLLALHSRRVIIIRLLLQRQRRRRPLTTKSRRDMAHHLQLVLLLLLNELTILQDQSHVDALTVWHEEHPIVTSDTSRHSKPLKVNSLVVDGLCLCAGEHLHEALLPHEVVLLVRTGS